MDLHQLVQDAIHRLHTPDGSECEDGSRIRLQSVTEVAGLIDHTLLKPEATKQQIEQLCAEARSNQFASVCVNPIWTRLCHDVLDDTSVGVATVVGFPLGANSMATKVYETEDAIRSGANEIDMVIQIGQLKDGNYQTVWDEIQGIVEIAHSTHVLVKTILETGLLSEEEKIAAVALAADAKADFVKTSTGFGRGGATVEDVRLMRRVGGINIGVKASGGIRSYEELRRMIRAGATRIGTSAGIVIVQEAEAAMVKADSEVEDKQMGEY